MSYLASLRKWFPRGNKFSQRRKPRIACLLRLEALEERRVPASIYWANPSGGSWQDGNNWVGGQVPGAADDAFITLTGNFTVSCTTGQHTVRQLQSTQNLTISGSCNMTVGQRFQLSSGKSLSVAGPGVQFTANGDPGSTQISGANLTANDQGQLRLPAATNINSTTLYAMNGGYLGLSAATSYVHTTTGHGQHRVWQASNGGVLDLPALRSITSNTAHRDSYLYVDANTGGTVNLPGVASVGGNRIHITASGGGTVDLAALRSFNDGANAPQSRLAAWAGGTIVLSGPPAQITLNGVELVLDGTLNTAGITHFTNGRLVLNRPADFTSLISLAGSSVTLNGVDQDFSRVTDLTNAAITANGAIPDLGTARLINSSSLYAINGGRLALPAATSYVHTTTGHGQNRILRASNGGVLDLSGLRSISSNSARYDSTLYVEALTGGAVNLSNVGGVSGNRIHITAGGGSTVDLAALRSFNDGANAPQSRLAAWAGGTIVLSGPPAQITLNGVELILDGTLNTAGITHFTNGRLTLNQPADFTSLTSLAGSSVSLIGVSQDFGRVTNLFNASIGANNATADLSRASEINSVSLHATNGAYLALPAATSYVHATTGHGQNRILRASNGGVLDLSGLRSISSNSAGYDSYLDVDALTGGFVHLPAVTNISGNRIRVTANGGGSVVWLSQLGSFQETRTAGQSTLKALGGGATILHLAGTSTLTSLATEVVGSGSFLYGTGVTTAAGSVRVESGGFLYADALAFNGTAVRVGPGSALGGSSVILNGSTVLSGSGDVYGDVVNRATVRPGNDAVPFGVLTVYGNYTQEPLGTLDVRINGRQEGIQYTKLVVTGDVVLAGTLNARFGFRPDAGDAFRVLDYYGTRTGDFAAKLTPGLAQDLDVSFNYDATGLNAEVFSRTGPGGVPDSGGVGDSPDGVIAALAEAWHHRPFGRKPEALMDVLREPWADGAPLA